MGRASGLTAVWLVCTASAVGVGFAAAGLVEYPRSAAAGPHPAGVLGASSREEATPRPGATPTSTSPQSVRAPGGSARGSPGGLEPNRTEPGQSSALPGLSTDGGYVGGTCSGGTIQVSASPNPGWTVADLREPGEDEAEPGEVFFVRPGAGQETIAVEAWCLGEIPVFAIDGEEADDHDTHEVHDPEEG
jgi:hypothetical protein